MARMAVQSASRDSVGRVIGTMWCYTSAKRPCGDRIRTLCGYWISMPWGVEERAADCPECLAIDAVGGQPSPQETANPSPGDVCPQPGPRH